MFLCIRSVFRFKPHGMSINLSYEMEAELM